MKQFLFVLSLIVIGCSPRYAQPMVSDGYQSTDIVKTEAVSNPEIPSTDKEIGEAESTNQARKIIYDISLTLQLDSLFNQTDKILNITNSYQGYVVQSNYNYAQVRVPVEHMESAIKDLKSLGKLVNEGISGKDITEEYFDLQTRLDNAEQTRKRYLKLLDKASTIEEILSVEKELQRLNDIIEVFKGRLKRMDELHQYATITLRFQENYQMPKTEQVVTKPGIVGYVFVGLYKGVKWLFVREVKTDKKKKKSKKSKN